jgi:hypothetical protein
MVTAKSTERARRPATADRGEAEQPRERGRIPVPVLADDGAVGRVEDEPEGESRDDRVVEGTDDGNEFRNEVDR